MKNLEIKKVLIVTNSEGKKEYYELDKKTLKAIKSAQKAIENTIEITKGFREFHKGGVLISDAKKTVKLTEEKNNKSVLLFGTDTERKDKYIESFCDRKTYINGMHLSRLNWSDIQFDEGVKTIIITGLDRPDSLERLFSIIDKGILINEKNIAPFRIYPKVIVKLSAIDNPDNIVTESAKQRFSIIKFDK